MAKGDMFDIEGDLGNFNYSGMTLEAVDQMVDYIASYIVAPEVWRGVAVITGETKQSIKTRREGLFDPRGKSGVGPTYSVYSDPSIIDIQHAMVLEYAQGGKYSFMRSGARSKTMKRQIGKAIKQRWGGLIRSITRNTAKVKSK